MRVFLGWVCEAKSSGIRTVELFDGAYEPISLSNDLLLLADVD
jgi:hypothetical protein